MDKELQKEERDRAMEFLLSKETTVIELDHDLELGYVTIRLTYPVIEED